MTLQQGVFLDLDSLHPADLNMQGFEQSLPQWQLYPATGAAEAAQRIAGAEVVVSNKVVLDAALLRAAPQLKLICVAATGTNNVDLEEAKRLQIAVTNVPAYGTASVAQHVFAMLLSLTTRLSEQQAAARDGRWARSPFFCVLDHPSRELAGKSLGIVGYGTLGKGVAKLAEAFGMRVVLARRPGGEPQAGRVDLDDLLRSCDVVSLHLPLMENTRQLIGARELDLMKSDAILINTARGGIVDEVALLAALTDGRLGGAGVDVLESEPPQAGNQLLEATLPNLIVTPHVAWAAREARQRLLDILTGNIQAFQRGESLNRVA